MSSLPINVSDSLNNWADSVSKVKELRLNLSDNLNNWQDSGGMVLGVRVSQLPVEIFTSSSGNVRISQSPVEILVPTDGLIQLVLSDSFTLTDSVTKTLEKRIQASGALTMADSVSAVPSAPLTLTVSDSWNSWLDSVSTRLFTQLQLSVSDSWNSWLDAVSTLLAIPLRLVSQLPVEILTSSSSNVRISQGPVEILVPTNGLIQLTLSDNLNNWLSAASTSFPKIAVASDSMTMADSVIVRMSATISLNLSDSMVMTDSVQVSLATQLNLTLSDSWNGWLDSVSTATAVSVQISVVVSDTLNFWLDAFDFSMPVAPRTAPVGDPSDNCCPPNIFITD